VTFEVFVQQVHALVDGTAAGKGYNTTGPDGHNNLFEFVESMVGGDGHALGEIIYKVQRYSRKRHPDDMLKVAAWAFLVLKHRHE
jgi:Na+-transporting NADH:ubiquinone oxidoreductase subunit NqrD